MPADGIEVHGVAELERGARRLFANVEEAAPGAFRSVADQVATVVRARVPRRSGRLAGSVMADHDREGAAVGFDGRVPYAGWIEFGGTRGRPYVPTGRYLYPTASDIAPDPLRRAGERAVEGEIRRMTWPRVMEA